MLLNHAENFNLFQAASVRAETRLEAFHPSRTHRTVQSKGAEMQSASRAATYCSIGETLSEEETRSFRKSSKPRQTDPVSRAKQGV